MYTRIHAVLCILGGNILQLLGEPTAFLPSQLRISSKCAGAESASLWGVSTFTCPIGHKPHLNIGFETAKVMPHPEAVQKTIILERSAKMGLPSEDCLSPNRTPKPCLCNQFSTSSHMALKPRFQALALVSPDSSTNS